MMQLAAAGSPGPGPRPAADTLAAAGAAPAEVHIALPPASLDRAGEGDGDSSTVEGFAWNQRDNSPAADRRLVAGQQAFAAALVLAALKARPVLDAVNAKVVALLRSCQAIFGAGPLASLLTRIAKAYREYRAQTIKIAAVTAVAGLFAFASRVRSRRNSRRRAKRVAVVGAGIAGCGAAWALERAGVEVVVYEKKPKLGGNAKAYTWDVEGRKVETGLAVFAWPRELFHGYNAMIDELGIETEDHDTRFYVSERQSDGSTKCVFAHDKAGWQPEPWLKSDLAKWDSLVQFVTKMNAFFQPSESHSLYRASFLNPCNMIPLHRACLMWGISQRFWDLVFVPIHTSTFLEVEMGTVPAAMAELLDEIVPFSRTPNLRTWKTHAYDTVLKLVEKIPKQNLRTSCAVETVAYSLNKHGDGFDIAVTDEDDRTEQYDAIIFACSAQGMNRILHGKGDPMPGQVLLSNPHNGLNNASEGLLSRLYNWMETSLLSRTLYTTDRDKTFERGIVHTCADAVVPEEHRKEVLDAYCNYIEVDAKNPRNLENTFVISSWAPTAQEPDVRGKLPMLVTYNAEDKLKDVKTEWVSTSREAHPCLTIWQLFSTVMLWPILQGARRDQTYFCGSAVLPANGHDLSFMSGLVAAAELGAPFPFPNNRNAWADYQRLRGMMLGIWA